jgi:hypothetical protein
LKTLENGPATTPLKEKSVKELLKVISENTVNNEGAIDLWNQLGWTHERLAVLAFFPTLFPPRRS